MGLSFSVGHRDARISFRPLKEAEPPSQEGTFDLVFNRECPILAAEKVIGIYLLKSEIERISRASGSSLTDVRINLFHHCNPHS